MNVLNDFLTSPLLSAVPKCRFVLIGELQNVVMNFAVMLMDVLITQLNFNKFTVDRATCKYITNENKLMLKSLPVAENVAM